MFMPNLTQPQQFVDAWKKMFDAHMSRLEQLDRQLGEMQSQGQTKVVETIDESAKLMKEGFEYTQQLSAEWRKLMMESAKQSMSLMTANVPVEAPTEKARPRAD